MKVEVLMPKLGESITEGTVVKWWKKPGDYIKKEETLLEISTDKVDSEIPSPYEGKIVELKANENETVEVDSVLAVVDTVDNGVQEQAEGDGQIHAEQPEDGDPREATTAPPSKEKEPAMSGGNGDVVVEIEMPRLGESITEGTVVKWWKKPGDYVKKEETILEISTDKVDSEIPSPFEGTIVELLADENQTVEVGSAIAKVRTGAAAAGIAQSAAPIAEPSPAPRKTSGAAPMAKERAGETTPVKREKGGRFYSPLVRNIARKENISMTELESISGSGLKGRVTKKDILNYLESGRPAASAPAAAAPTPSAAPQLQPAAPSPGAKGVAEKWRGERVEVIPMDAVRKKIADHMVMSKQTSPHVYGVAECDFTRVTEIVNKHRQEFQQRQGFKLTINPFILYSVVKAINDFPGVNASVEGNTIILKQFINIGMAVATDRGLIVPTLKNAGELNFTGIARNAYDLAIRARDSKLTIDDVQGATITVTNYGVFGNIIGFPIINQPNVAIVGVGAIKKRPVVIETEQGDMIGIRSMGFLTMSYDHRIVDGELGDKYLQRVVEYLQNFEEEWM